MKKLTKTTLICLLAMLCVVALALVACEQTPPPSKDKVTVTFDTGIDGLTVPAQTIAKGAKASAPQIQSGYKVFGWYTTSACVVEFDFDKAIDTDVTVYGKILKGEGTTESPFEVASAQALHAFTNYGAEHNYVGKLVADISYSSNVGETYTATTFNGSLDGQGHTITLEASNTGIFYKLGENGQIKDLKVVGHIEAAVGSCGVVVNHNYGTVTNITTEGTEIHWNTSGTVSNGYKDGIYSVMGTVGTRGDALATAGADAIAGAGGIVGTNYASATVKDCLNRMNVRAVVGGGCIAAVNYGKIEHCFNDGCVGTTGDTASNFSSAYDFSYLGGMAGINYGTITQCGNLNKVYAQRLPWLYSTDNTATNYRMNIGGIAGENIATKEGDNYVGGIITECFSYGRIHGDTRVGGIAGQSNGYIANCAAYGLFGARYRLGGIVGYQKDDDAGIVDSCSAMFRVKSSQTSAVVDGEGTSHTVEALEDGKVSANTDTIVDFFCLAKYATNSIFHNNCGNIAPIDPATGDKGSNSTTKGAELFNGMDTLTAGGAENAWAEDATDEETHKTPTMVAINGSYQIYLNAYLAWQKATITAIGLDGKTTTFDARQGINYTQDPLTADGDKWEKANSNRNMSGYLPNTGLPTAEVAEGKMVIWTTVKDDASTIWDGICRGDITVYAMVVDAPTAQ
jgi:hypothetical protein